jgi:CxxC motif-containing protein
MICITCPMGCRLEVERKGEDDIAVSGNRCPRGAAYAREELLSPKRVVTATCRALPASGAGAAASDRPVRRIPCRSSVPFPKERVGELLAAIYGLEVPLPVRRGQVLIPDALGMGIDVVATRSVG